MEKFLEDIIGKINDLFYGNILIIILVAGGLFFTVFTKFVPFRLLKEQFRSVGEKNKDGVSSFQALMVSTASRVGTGNIVGVSTALCLGGFGSMFWMWLIAIVGASSAFIESTLAQIYKRRGKEGCYGGPAYYIESGLKLRWLAVIFSVVLIFTYGVGFNMLASYNLQSTFEGYSFYNTDYAPWIIGGIVALLVGLCLFGGGKSLINVTSICIPFMGILYLLVALLVVALNITTLPSVIKTIFVEAFDFKAIFGGFSGSCVMYGIKRGLFSNEAGVGSAPNASASAEVSHPVKQGLVQILSVFIDTLVICTATGVMCMCSGIAPSEELSGAPYVQASLRAVLGDIGPVFITVSMVLFAFTTLLGNLFYVEKCLSHILKREPGAIINTVYRILACLVIFVGAGLSANLLWGISDIAMGILTLINMPVIVILGRFALRALKDYEKQRKEGKDPVFKAETVGLAGKTEYWQ